MTAEPRLDPPHQALAAFLRDLPELYETNPEQFVAYQGSQRLGVGPVKHLLYQDCMAAGHELAEFVVFHVAPIETETWFDPQGE